MYTYTDESMYDGVELCSGDFFDRINGVISLGKYVTEFQAVVLTIKYGCNFRTSDYIICKGRGIKFKIF